MKKFIVSVTEDISHSYEIMAESKEAALEAYDKLTHDELLKLDLDGSHNWDVPWDVEELELSELREQSWHERHPKKGSED
jgi:hypothetical protein